MAQGNDPLEAATRDGSGKGLAIGAVATALLLATPIVAKWEGLRTKPYLDPIGIPTVCYGETKVAMRPYTVAECKAMLTRALESRYAPGVYRCVPALRNRPYQAAAAISLTYNIGEGAFCKSSIAKRFQAGDYRGGCQRFGLYVYAGGRKLQGLVNRRADETRLCMTGL